MLDLIGTMVLTAAIAVNLNAAIAMMPLSFAQKLTTAALAGLWIGLAVALASTGIYDTRQPRAFAALIFLMVDAVIFGVGIVAVLSIPALAAQASFSIPAWYWRALGLASIVMLASTMMLRFCGRTTSCTPIPNWAGEPGEAMA